ncbi:MAG TPA: hypothetical protein VLJ39_21300 [Tepidisphaeraceae bacterium]|nr:hypothetical protein [Tepidisphaeraceae bacterium]
MTTARAHLFPIRLTLLLGLIAATGLSIPGPVTQAASSASPGVSHAPAPATEPALVSVIAAPDFWATTGTAKPAPQADKAAWERELRNIASTSDQPAMRIRALKLLCDLDGHFNTASGLKKDQALAATATAFTWLEAHLKDAEVAKYAPELGFTHVTLSRRSGDAKGIWVLIESAALPPGFSGGLNVRFDEQTGTIDHFSRWGEVRPVKHESQS